MDNLKEGDTVQLKSGGPKMTVHRFNEDGTAYCQWFAGDKIEGASFPQASLNRLESK
jgi:uncharacterized protein YodC (DUF2158 family)